MRVVQVWDDGGLDKVVTLSTLVMKRRGWV